MILKIKQFIEKQNLFNRGNTLIAAVSGGKDSMALIHILKQLEYKFIVAHCNFNLRGEESDADEQFVAEYCKKNNLAFQSIQFDTKAYSKANKVAIQEAARTLRYDWFEKLRIENKATCIVTAHHLNDNIETFLFKAVRGTGVKGMRGMLPKNGHLVRPLLETSLADIENYVKENKIQYREDSSNASTKYDRNKIRHEVVPVLKELNSNLESNFENHFKRWRAIEQFYEASLTKWKKELFKQKNKDFYIAIAKIKNIEFAATLLFDIFKDYGFNQADISDLLHSLDSKEVKYFYSNSHRIIKDKKFIVLTELKYEAATDIYILNTKSKKITLSDNQYVRVILKPITKLSKMNKGNNYAYLDADKLTFPLVLRRRKEGDYFYPLGLSKKSGKPSKKKVSKYFKDEKVSAIDKENSWVLCSGEKIAWLVNYRLDERFKVTDKTQNVLILQFGE